MSISKYMSVHSSNCHHHPVHVLCHSGITSLDPKSGPVTGGNTIIINGYNLLQTKLVTMGSVPVQFIILSDTAIKIFAC